MANIYVRAGASGAANGTDWTNAFTAIPSAVTRGDTVYVATGSYGTPNALDDAVSSTTVSFLKKATVADHGTSTGWNDAYGTGQAVFSGNLFIHTGYWVVDGQVGGGPGSWQSGHGFKFKTIQIINANFEINDPVPGGNIELRHIELEGTLTPGTDDAVSTATLDGLIVSHCYTHNTDNCPFNLYVSTNITVQYCYSGEFASHPIDHHAEIFFLYGRGNVTIRWNLFRWAESTGGIMCNNPNGEPIQIYGNVFYRAAGETWAYGGDGLVGTWSNRADLSLHDMTVANNTFIGIELSDSGGNCAAVIGTTPHSDLVWVNNLFYECEGGTGLPNGAWANNYNHYVNSGSESEANGSTASGDPFFDYTDLDFSLVSNTPAGEDLGSPYNVDMLGNTRTTWTRGAIEFAEETETTVSVTTLTLGTLTIG